VFDVRLHETPGAFLARGGGWLEREEARYNLILSLARGRAEAGEWPEGAAFMTVEQDGVVAGCAMRTPPHKLLVTDMPLAAAPHVARQAADLYESMPCVLGPAGPAEAVAMAWVALRGGGWRRGMEQGLYRLTEVNAPPADGGEMRVAVEADVDMAVAWGEGFSRDVGVVFPTQRSTVLGWIEAERLHIWEDGGSPVSIAVAHGLTGNGVRVGYVYTPPELRGRGYASRLVACLSQKMLDAGCAFCVLYTDLSNPTSNAIYQRVGYALIDEVQDFDLIPEEAL
jgi:predicted GNAT family acetyltransferase